MTMRWTTALVLALALGACKMKLKSDKKDDPAPPQKPVCTRAINRDIPTAFQSQGVAVAAVKTEDCSTLVVGHDVNKNVIVGKYDAAGNAVDTYGNRGIMKPLEGRYGGYDVKVQRLAVINGGYYAFGTYARSSTDPRALFVFRLLDSGFLDLGYGPLHDGIARASVDPNFSLNTIGTPSVEPELIRFHNRGEDLAGGFETEREQVVLISGNQAFDKSIVAVPAQCDIINHTVARDQTTVQLTQATCAEMSFHTIGPLGSDALTVAMNGTTYGSNLLGEMRWFYEGATPVLMSHDGLGFARKDYVAFAPAGATSICGTSVNPNGRYLVFSPKPPQAPDWLANCWFL